MLLFLFHALSFLGLLVFRILQGVIVFSSSFLCFLNSCVFLFSR